MAKWIVKASDAVLSHCRCEAPLASVSVQLDCPWCGCGWLLSCIDCRKAFTFGRVVSTDLSYAQIARHSFEKGGYDLSDDDISGAAEWLEAAMSNVDIGDTVVYLDGLYFCLDDRDVAFEGEYANHDLERLPHAIARDRQALDAMLGQRSYWLEREREGRDTDN